jgi:hypothetical protein
VSGSAGIGDIVPNADIADIADIAGRKSTGRS